MSGLLLLLLLAAACTSENEPDSPTDEGAPGEEFSRRVQGSFVRVAPVPAPGGGTAYLRETLIFSGVNGVLRTEAYLDEALTQRVFVYESSGPYVVRGVSALFPEGYDLDLTNDTALLTVELDDPNLIAALGFDDCELEIGVAKDVTNGCAAPTFRFTACVDMDVFVLSADDRTFRWGDSTIDHCVTRPTTLDPLRAP